MKSLLLCWLSLVGMANAESAVHQFQAPHMGCLFTFKIVSEDEETAAKAAAAAFARVGELDAKFSDYRADSELSKLSATAGSGETVPMSPDLSAIMNHSARLWKWSEGTFDVTLGACTKLWRASRKSLSLPEAAVLTSALETVGFQHLKFTEEGKKVSLTKAGTVLDLGGIAKGFALDEVTALLKTKFKLDSFLLDAGGQLAAIGHPPGRDAWSLAIEKLNVEDKDSPTLVLKLKDRHLATSGDLHQSVTINGKNYAHIINPQAGLGLSYTIQASVLADNGTDADAIATALCLLPKETAMEKLKLMPNVEARVLRQELGQPLTIWRTPGWAAFEAERQEH